MNREEHRERMDKLHKARRRQVRAGVWTIAFAVNAVAIVYGYGYLRRTYFPIEGERICDRPV